MIDNIPPDLYKNILSYIYPAEREIPWGQRTWYVHHTFLHMTLTSKSMNEMMKNFLNELQLEDVHLCFRCDLYIDERCIGSVDYCVECLENMYDTDEVYYGGHGFPMPC